MPFILRHVSQTAIKTNTLRVSDVPLIVIELNALISVNYSSSDLKLPGFPHKTRSGK